MFLQETQFLQWQWIIFIQSHAMGAFFDCTYRMWPVCSDSNQRTQTY